MIVKINWPYALPALLAVLAGATACAVHPYATLPAALITYAAVLRLTTRPAA